MGRGVDASALIGVEGGGVGGGGDAAREERGTSVERGEGGGEGGEARWSWERRRQA
jgi:hypothetical protein